MTVCDRAPDWHLVVPVKGGPHAKSRLAVPAPLERPAVAEAIARDCVAACLRGMPRGRVVVVTGDPRVREWAGRAGAQVVADPDGGLNAAVAAAFSALVPARDVAVLLGDLPCLTPAELGDALAACAAYPLAVVPDAQGDGTTLLTTRTGRLTPRFGPGSAAAHEALGHVRLELDLPLLRTDVDDAGALARALGLGVGPRTAQALAQPVTE
ncbi:MAG: 2-phospho-L-lactate guanylyltransferase [Micrococcales bacterium]|nr:2-phospho-L-lactate guanylyltransferase [Micrococcales bacterium]